MAHQVERMAYVGQVPWHGLGTPITKRLTSVSEILKVTGTDWKVGYKELQTVEGESVEEFARATYRESDGKLLGVIGPKTHILQNHEALAPLAGLIKKGELDFETGGSLNEGRRVWYLAKVAGRPIEPVRGDVIERFVLISNAHDGSAAVRFGFTPVRVVCANTEAAAIRHKDSQLIRFRHSQDVKDNLAQVAKLMNMANATFEATAEQYAKLARKQINQNDLTRYIRLVLTGATVKNGKIVKPERETKRETRMLNLIEDCLRLHDMGRGSDIKGVRGTAWGAYNAVSEFLNHEAGHSRETRMNSLWFGPNHEKNSRALEIALAM